MSIKSYRGLEVWARAVDLGVEVYAATRQLPAGERFGLTSQMRRSAVSVPANIAEGNGRLHRGDYVHHLSIARGSLLELETHVVIAVRLSMLTREDAAPLWHRIQQVSKMLNKLIASLRPIVPASNT